MQDSHNGRANKLLMPNAHVRVILPLRFLLLLDQHIPEALRRKVKEVSRCGPSVAPGLWGKYSIIIQLPSSCLYRDMEYSSNFTPHSVLL